MTAEIILIYLNKCFQIDLIFLQIFIYSTLFRLGDALGSHAG